MHLLPICGELLNDSAPILCIRGRPEFAAWAGTLAVWADKEDLAPFREVLRDLAGNALTDREPLKRFLDNVEQESSNLSPLALKSAEPAPTVGQPGEIAQPVPIDRRRQILAEYLRAARFVDDHVGENRYAAFVAALVVTSAWMASAGEELYAQGEGIPIPGWGTIVPVLARAALKTGAVVQARLIVRQAYEHFMAAKIPNSEVLQRLRQMAWQIEERYDARLRYFAEQLRESCQLQEPNFRPEVGALLWTMGLVPESLLFHANARVSVVPLLPFFKRIISQSLARIPHDPLIQYVWLELKDRQPFNIREHNAFFGTINRRYLPWSLDEFRFVPASKEYAMTLIAWFRGTLTKEQARGYLASYVNEFSREHMTPGFIEVRLRLLAILLDDLFVLSHGRMTRTAMIEEWSSLVSFATETRQQAELHPERTERASSLMGSLCHRIKSATAMPAQAGVGGQELDAVITSLEEYRASAMTYWLDAVPPLPRRDEEVVASLLKEEEELLVGLRGAYFLILYEQLPLSFRRYTTEPEEFWDGSPSRSLNAATGQKEYNEIKAELEALWEKMAALAPGYAAARRSPVADLDALLAAISVPATRAPS